MSTENWKETDIEVLDARTTYSPIALDHPFMISGRTIAWFTLAFVDVTVRNRRGDVATGRGSTILSVPWSWPASERSVEHRDQVLRTLTDRLAEQACDNPPTDPIHRWLQAHDTLADTAAAAAGTAGVHGADGGEPVPALAAALATGAVDNALHDGWARAAGRPAHTMYTGRYLHDDLAAVLGPVGTGRWPGDFLTAPRSRIAVQHLVGAGDPLEPADTSGDERSVRDWLTVDGIRHVKVKVPAREVREDAHRTAAIHRVGRDLGVDLALAIDPNEGYEKAEDVVDLLDTLDRIDPAAARAVSYVEQPVPRDGTPDPIGLARAAERVPVVMDEGLVDPRAVGTLGASGWSGVVIKAGKGHSAALLTHAAATASGLHVTVQDLTAVDLALRHSARLVTLFDLPSAHLEYNSRQYAPAANDGLRETWPDLATVANGAVTVPPPSEPGLY